MTQRLPISIACAVVLCSFMSSCQKQKSNLYKFRMPGNYNVQLDKNVYTVWVFRNWKSLGVNNQSDSKIEPLIVSEPNKQIPCKKLEEGTADFFEKPQHIGQPEYQVSIPKTGHYQISSTEECVLVLVPPQSIYVGLNSNRNVRGLDDDFDVER